MNIPRIVKHFFSHFQTSENLPSRWEALKTRIMNLFNAVVPKSIHNQECSKPSKVNPQPTYQEIHALESALAR